MSPIEPGTRPIVGPAERDSRVPIGPEFPLTPL